MDKKAKPINMVLLLFSFTNNTSCPLL